MRYNIFKNFKNNLDFYNWLKEKGILKYKLKCKKCKSKWMNVYNLTEFNDKLGFKCNYCSIKRNIRSNNLLYERFEKVPLDKLTQIIFVYFPNMFER
jgi:hypothetical protein